MAVNHQPQHLSSSASSDDEVAEEDASSSSSEEQAVEVSEEDHQIPTPLPKKPSSQNQPKIPSSHPQSSSNPKIKPISSKSKPVAEDPPSKSAAKHKSQKAKRKASDVEVEIAKEKTNVDDRNNKKPMLLFSEGDEIVILESMIEHGLTKGVERMPDIKEFHEFVKKSLSFVGATKTQLYEKVRRLRQKYERNATRANPGLFSKPHEVKVFELSKKIWENNDGGNALGNEGVRKRRKRGSVGLPKEGEKSEVERMGMGTGFEISAGGFGSVGFLGSVGGWSLDEEAVKIWKDELELINESDKLELERKWEQMMVEEVEHYLKKLDLIREQMMLVLEAMKS